MTTIGNIFEIGRSALLTHQQGVNLTSHNISNVNTRGILVNASTLRRTYRTMPPQAPSARA